MAKKLLKQMELFDEMSSHGLSPNQYYIMCSMRDSVTPIKVNMYLEMRGLLADDWITKDNGLTPKSITLIDKLEKLFVIQKKKTSAQLMGKGFKENIGTYVEMFPNIKLPSGKAARSALGNLEKNFRWFFENHEYDWKLVFTATAAYINDQQKKQWKFCRTSQYFIRKNEMSDLADYCEMIKTGGYSEEKPLYSVKVV